MPGSGKNVLRSSNHNRAADTRFISSLVVIKIIMGVHLLSYATRRRAGMEAREAADVINDFGREPIGEGKDEQVMYFLSRRN